MAVPDREILLKAANVTGLTAAELERRVYIMTDPPAVATSAVHLQHLVDGIYLPSAVEPPKRKTPRLPQVYVPPAMLKARRKELKRKLRERRTKG